MLKKAILKAYFFIDMKYLEFLHQNDIYHTYVPLKELQESDGRISFAPKKNHTTKLLIIFLSFFYINGHLELRPIY